jgi:hypothetical protein
MSASPKREHVRRRLEERYRRLEEARSKRPAAAILARFNEIDGGTQSGLVSIELFTTVIPLIILGFGYFSGFAKDASPGILLIRELGLQHPLSDRVREAFGTSSGLRSSWTIIGVAGFLVWGIPMSITIAGIFARAWRREQFGLSQRLLRGATWFVLYLTMIGFRERIGFAGDHTGAMRVLLFGGGTRTGMGLLVAHAGSPGPGRWPGMEVPCARRARRRGDRRNHHPARRPGHISSVAPRLGRVRPDRCRDDIDHVVRGDRLRMGSDSMRGRGPVGAHRPARNRHRVTDNRIQLLAQPGHAHWPGHQLPPALSTSDVSSKDSDLSPRRRRLGDG